MTLSWLLHCPVLEFRSLLANVFWALVDFLLWMHKPNAIDPEICLIEAEANSHADEWVHEQWNYRAQFSTNRAQFIFLMRSPHHGGQCHEPFGFSFARWNISHDSTWTVFAPETNVRTYECRSVQVHPWNRFDSDILRCTLFWELIRYRNRPPDEKL